MQHRYSSLEEVERRRSNYSEGVQKYLSTRIPGEELLQAKTLADHIETDPAYEAAMEDYLNDPLQYILVDSRDDAVQGVERLKRIGAGKCTFMTLRNGHSRHSSDAAAPPERRRRRRLPRRSAAHERGRQGRLRTSASGLRLHDHGLGPEHRVSRRRKRARLEFPDSFGRILFDARHAVRSGRTEIDGRLSGAETRKTRTGQKTERR